MGYAMMMDQVQHQVVEKVLKGYLEGDDLNSAVNLWDKQYSNQPMDKLSFFVFEIATSSTLRSLRKQILSDLERNLTQEDKNPTQPIATGKAVKQKVSEEIIYPLAKEMEEAKSEPEPVVSAEALNHCFNMLMSHLKSFDLKELTTVLNEHLEGTEGVPGFIKDELLLIALSEHKVNYLIYDVQHIRTSLNVVYSVLCEYFGPTKADRILAQTVAQVEKSYPLENFVRFL